FQRAAAFLSDGDSIGLIGRLENGDADFVIPRLAPAVGRVRLADVDRQESDAVFVTLMNLFQDPRLGSIRPAGEAAEDEYNRLSAAVLREAILPIAVLGSQSELRRFLPHSRAFMNGSELPRGESFQQDS